MLRSFGMVVLITCFGLSSVDAARATEIINSSPIIVQPYEVQSLNQEVMDRDRHNRDEEIAIQNLIEANNKLTQQALAAQQDVGLSKVNQTMLDYRNALLARDRARIIANGELWGNSRYGDLIALTEDTDDITVHQDLVAKSDLLAQKYQMLTDLKDEMTSLNDKLSHQDNETLNQKDTLIAGYKKIALEQQDKVQMLVSRLDALDQKIAHFDDIIAQKDKQIFQLRENLATVQNEVATKNELIDDQKTQIAILQGKSQEMALKDQQIKSQSAQIARLSEPSNLQGDLLSLKSQLKEQVEDLKAKDEIIKDQKNQIDLLRQNIQAPAPTHGNVELPPVIVNTPSNPLRPASSAQLSQKQEQVDLLKEELENKITELNKLGEAVSAKDKIIKQQETQIVALRTEPSVEPNANVNGNANAELIKSQAAQIASLTDQLKIQSSAFGDIQSKIASLKVKIRNQMQLQADQMKAKDESLRWSKQMLAAAKDKAEYFKLTARQEKIKLRQLQDDIQQVKNEFAQRSQNYDQFERSFTSLKDQVGHLFAQLAHKQGQVDLLKEELENKITELKNQGYQDHQRQQDLKDQLQQKEGQIVAMKAEILSILQKQTNKDVDNQKTTTELTDRVSLAKQLIDLQQQEASLLDEKGSLEERANNIFDRHFSAFENRMKTLVANRRIEDMDWRNQLETLQNILSQKQQEIESFKEQLQEKIANEQNQAELQGVIDNLRAQLQDEENQISAMKRTVLSDQASQAPLASLRQALTDEQNRESYLKQELASRDAQSKQMTLIIAQYQRRLEARDSAYNEELKSRLHSKSDLTQLEAQITYLNTRLQQKEAELVKAKKEIYDLRDLANSKDRDLQAKDLTLTIMQQKTRMGRIKEYQDKIDQLESTNGTQAQEIKGLKTQLALVTQELNGMPSSDEVNFLRTGLKEATTQLKEKEAMLAQIKSNADEYEKEFKAQTLEFKSLKEQLQNAYEEISRRNEDLKYKNLEVTRLKERSAIAGGDLGGQVKTLTQKLEMADRELRSKNHENKVEALEAQLMKAKAEIKDLRERLNQFIAPSASDPVREKLKQALAKIDELGGVIKVLSHKLEESGQTANLSVKE